MSTTTVPTSCQLVSDHDSDWTPEPLVVPDMLGTDNIAQTCAGIMLDLPQGNCTELSFAVISVAQVMVVRRSETDVKHSLCSSITFVRQ